MPMRVNLAYGEGEIALAFPEGADVTVIGPRPTPGLADEEASLRAALESPWEALLCGRWLATGGRSPSW